MSLIGGVLPTTWVRAEDLRMTPDGELHISTEDCSTRAGCRPVVVTVAPKIKPEEPTGFAAVVKADGTLWARVDDDAYPWRSLGGSWLGWDNFDDDVEILHPGVDL